jgi:hypothetical protein
MLGRESWLDQAGSFTMPDTNCFAKQIDAELSAVEQNVKRFNLNDWCSGSNAG